MQGHHAVFLRQGYDRPSIVGGGGKLSSLSRSFAANKVGTQSPKNHNRMRNAAAKMRTNPNQASHPQPGMRKPSTSKITPAIPTKSGRRYDDDLLFGPFPGRRFAMVTILLSLTIRSPIQLPHNLRDTVRDRRIVTMANRRPGNGPNSKSSSYRLPLFVDD